MQSGVDHCNAANDNLPAVDKDDYGGYDEEGGGKDQTFVNILGLSEFYDEIDVLAVRIKDGSALFKLVFYSLSHFGMSIIEFSV